MRNQLARSQLGRIGRLTGRERKGGTCKMGCGIDQWLLTETIKKGDDLGDAGNCVTMAYRKAVRKAVRAI